MQKVTHVRDSVLCWCSELLRTLSAALSGQAGTYLLWDEKSKKVLLLLAAAWCLSAEKKIEIELLAGWVTGSQKYGNQCGGEYAPRSRALPLQWEQEAPTE